jgi:hypothetical protein
LSFHSLTSIFDAFLDVDDCDHVRVPCLLQDLNLATHHGSGLSDIFDEKKTDIFQTYYK